MKLTISNETHFSARVLRSIILTVYRQVAKEEQRTLPTLRVRIAYARTWGQAHGALGYGRMTLFFRKSHEADWVKTGDLAKNGGWQHVRQPGHAQPRVSQVAATVRHELMHNYGYHHTQRGANSSNAEGWFYDRPLPDGLLDQIVARTGPLVPILEPKPKAPVDRVRQRYERIVAREKAWQARAKRAATALKKLRGQRRYYEQKLADVVRPGERVA